MICGGTGMGGGVVRDSADPKPVSCPIARIPLAIAGAPKTMKHPITTVIPRLASIRPESINSPHVAIASTPSIVAIDPSTSDSTQDTAGVSTLCATGSAREAPPTTMASTLPKP